MWDEMFLFQDTCTTLWPVLLYLSSVPMLIQLCKYVCLFVCFIVCLCIMTFSHLCVAMCNWRFPSSLKMKHTPVKWLHCRLAMVLTTRTAMRMITLTRHSSTTLTQMITCMAIRGRHQQLKRSVNTVHRNVNRNVNTQYPNACVLPAFAYCQLSIMLHVGQFWHVSTLDIFHSTRVDC